MFFPLVLDELPRMAKSDGTHPAPHHVTLAEAIGGEQNYIKMKKRFFDEIWDNQLIVGSALMQATAQGIVEDPEFDVPMHLRQRAVEALQVAYLRRTPKYANVTVEFIRENGGLLLNPEDNPYDFTAEQMAINTALASTAYDLMIAELKAEVKAYGIKIPEDIKKFSPDIRKFAVQTQRRIGTYRLKQQMGIQ